MHVTVLKIGLIWFGLNILVFIINYINHRHIKNAKIWYLIDIMDWGLT